MSAVLTLWDNICLKAPTKGKRTFPVAPGIFPTSTTLPFPPDARRQGCFNVTTVNGVCRYFTRWTKEMSFGTMTTWMQDRGGSGWPWQITNRRMDKMSLARQKKTKQHLGSQQSAEKTLQLNTAILLGCRFFWASQVRNNYVFNSTEWNYLWGENRSGILF